MGFAKLSTDEISKLVKTYKDTKGQHTALNKGANKLLKKNDIAKLEKTMKETGKAVSLKLAVGMKSARGYFEKHAKDVQDWMIQAVKFQKTQEEAMKRFLAKPTQIWDRDIVVRAVDEIKAILNKAEVQDKEYGIAWSEFRGYNATNQGLDPEYAKDYLALRMKLMNDGKAVTGKIDRMEAMVKLATAIADKAQAANKKGLGDLNAARARAKKLETQAAAIYNDIINKKGNNISVLRNGSGNIVGIAERMEPTPEVLANVRDGLTNIATADKFIREQMVLLKKLTETFKATFDEDELDDAEIKKSFEAAAKNAEDAKSEYDKQKPNVEKAVKAGSAFMAKAKKK